ncbi:PREDICTED: uncharacterized protein LOC108369445 [Rhagoletis zephyria]|uniref:uncharacterized protein LOC108369445 n=1 Tax=Rhagoletis zephyria TaxID=28612 RepID=UPI0008113497|nr:PREDICTED: uncharacterized protein LOC108369445 [Rhagoletis zephyria]
MYKTVRHGENSLQYTILPQNDDFRIEGKLSSAGNNCSGAAGRKGKARRPRRRSFFAYLGLIFICTVIIGAILVPFLVSAECLPNPTEWFLKTKAALSHGGGINGLHRNVGGPREALRRTGENGGGHHLPQHNSAASIGQKVEIINSDGVEKIILRVNKTQAEPKLNDTKDRPVGYVSDKEEQPPTEETNAAAADKRMDGRTEPQKDIVTVGKDDAIAITTTMPAPNIGAGDGLGLPNKAEPPLEANNFVSEVRFDSGSMQSLPGVPPTIVVTTTMHIQPAQNGNQFNGNNNVGNNGVPSRPLQNGPAPAIRPTTSFSTTSIYSPHAPAAASAPAAATFNVNTISNQNASAVVLPTITTRIMQLPLLKSTAKKPIIPPVLARPNSEAIPPRQSDNSGADANGGNEPLKVNAADVVETKDADWIQSHWPYIDPSTYFQWTGYKEDSVLLPALLGFALTGMILIIAVCLVARNKRAIVSSVRKRNRNDVEEAGADDNTTLLTNANLSDED